MSNSLDPDQDQNSVGPDLGPKLFAGVTIRGQKFRLVASKERFKRKIYLNKSV